MSILPTSTKPTRPQLIFAALFILALLPRLAIVASPIETQLQKTLPDDAYYYFLTAQNILDGNPPSVDGINASNGWHPLWMLVNLVVFSLDTNNPDTPIRVLLVVAVLLDSLVAAFLFWIIRHHLSESASIIAGLIYALNSMPLLHAVNGLETSLSSLTILLAWWSALYLLEQVSLKRAVTLGIAFGLCFLARTDTAVILVCLGVYLAWKLFPRLAPLGAATLVALIVVSPWFIWNQATFGNPIVQVSSLATPWSLQAHFEYHHPDLPIWRLSLETFTAAGVWVRGDYFAAPPFVWIVLWLMAAVGLYQQFRKQPSHLLYLAMMLILGGAILVFIHALLRWFPRTWYFVVMAQSLSIGLACFWANLNSKAGRLATITGLLSLTILGGLLMWGKGYYEWQTSLQYSAALWLRDNSPPDTRLGAMNSGILGYYSERSTINLDGVVNPAAFEAMQENSMIDYMREEQIDLLIDTDYAINEQYTPFMGADFPQALHEVRILGEAYPRMGYVRAYEILPTDTPNPQGE
jgi:Dolichyl-phosphate-mannose-protein mannosyltransferase